MSFPVSPPFKSNTPFYLYGGQVESIVSNSCYGMLRGQIHTSVAVAAVWIKKKV